MHTGYCNGSVSDNLPLCVKCQVIRSLSCDAIGNGMTLPLLIGNVKRCDGFERAHIQIFVWIDACRCCSSQRHRQKCILRSKWSRMTQHDLCYFLYKNPKNNRTFLLRCSISSIYCFISVCFANLVMQKHYIGLLVWNKRVH